MWHDPEEEAVVSGIDVYKGYIGKNVKHKVGGIGVVTKCDGKYINYSLEMCLKKRLVELI